MNRRPFYERLVRETAFGNNKMAFVAGPRQVGKTTLGELLLKERPSGKTYTWDDIEFKRQWIKDPKQFVPDRVGPKSLLILDELHKAPRWKSTLKGLYDTRHEVVDILVTGSARLDVYRRGGDSLLGRYFLIRMHPFSLGELNETMILPNEMEQFLEKKILPDRRTFERLFHFGGFPDPYLKADPALWNLWRRMRLERIVREDLRDLTRIPELSLLESCATLIPERVGSLFSVQSLTEDLMVSHPTLSRWIHWFSQLYYLYSLPPYTRRVARSLKKQPKIYLWDWSEVSDESARFENMVGSHLLKACHYWTDSGQGNFELCFVRDKEKREVDFLILRDRTPWLLAECKLSDTTLSPHLFYFAQQLTPTFVLQVIRSSGVQERFSIDSRKKGYLISADAFLKLA